MTAYFTLRSKHETPNPRRNNMDGNRAKTVTTMKIRGVACVHPTDDGKFVLAFSMLGNADSYDPKRGRNICEGRAKLRAESDGPLRKCVADYTTILDSFQACRDLIHEVKKAANDTTSGMQYAAVVRDTISR
jgi:hypothetical protein